MSFLPVSCGYVKVILMQVLSVLTTSGEIGGPGGAINVQKKIHTQLFIIRLKIILLTIIIQSIAT